MRVLLAMRELEKREKLRLMLESEHSECSVACLGDGRAALAQVRTDAPDILYLDQILPLLDGPAVLEAIKEDDMICPPKVIFLTVPNCGQHTCCHDLSDMCIPAASDIAMLLSAASSVQGHLQSQLALLGTKRRGSLIQNHFDALGMPSRLSGRAYLAYLLDLAVPAPGLTDALTTRLYPAAAAQYATTPQAVERCIRHAIETTWSRGHMTALESLFGLSIDPDRGKPTNREFLAMSAQHIRQAYANANQ